MTDISELLRSFDRAKATGGNLTISVEDLAILMQVASLVGEPNRPAVELPKAPEPFPEPAPQDMFISIEEVRAVLRCSLSTLFRTRKDDPSFPKPIRASARRRLFVRAEFDEWLLSRR